MRGRYSFTTQGQIVFKVGIACAGNMNTKRKGPPQRTPHSMRLLVTADYRVRDLVRLRRWAPSILSASGRADVVALANFDCLAD